jgi:ABC-2 type transport system ATP-binding protein
MDRGQIIARGTHEELVKIVGELDRVDLTLNAPPERATQAWQDLTGVHKITTDNGTVTLLMDDSNVVLPNLFESANQHDMRITSVDIQEPNLEAVFLHLTGRALRD